MVTPYFSEGILRATLDSVVVNKRLAGSSTLVGDFLKGQKSTKLGSVKPSFTTGVTMGDIREVLPQKVVNTMRDALVQMDKKLKGFAMDEAVLTAPETRSSSPV